MISINTNYGGIFAAKPSSQSNQLIEFVIPVKKITVIRVLKIDGRTIIDNPGERRPISRAFIPKPCVDTKYEAIAWSPKRKKGDILSRLSSDVTEIQNSFLSILELLIRDPLTIIFTILLIKVDLFIHACIKWTFMIKRVKV